MALTPRQAADFRARAHALKPVVLVGGNGLTEAVVLATDAALQDHELIKVKWHEPTRDRLKQEVSQLAAGTQSDLAGLIGHTAILWRKRKRKAD